MMQKTFKREFSKEEYPERIEWRNAVGQLHKEDGPAILYPDGSYKYYLNGVIHRDGGPAIHCSTGDMQWWNNGLLHRENGPAELYSNGELSWRIKGNYHRENGPAVILNNGKVMYFIHGVQMTKEEFDSRKNYKKEYTMSEVANALGVPVGELRIKK